MAREGLVTAGNISFRYRAFGQDDERCRDHRLYQDPGAVETSGLDALT
jgi:hypothetical protein